MDARELRALQTPLKERYRADPGAALVTLRARGRLGEENVACRVETGKALVEAGLHPATGGDGHAARSGDLLTPLKERYRADPGAALVTLRARGRLGEENVACRVETGQAPVEAGLHPAT